MFIYFLLAVILILGVAVIRVLVEYSSKSDQFATSVRAHQSLIDEHRRETARMKKRSRQLRSEVHTLIKECSDIDSQILQGREDLAELEVQLERRRPKARQVRKDAAAADADGAADVDEASAGQA